MSLKVAVTQVPLRSKHIATFNLAGLQRSAFPGETDSLLFPLSRSFLLGG